MQTAQNGSLAGQSCSRQTFLTRKVNGFEMRDFGLGVNLGSHGQVRGFWVSWPNLEQKGTELAASADQVMRCIAARLTILALTPDGGFDLELLKRLAQAHKLTVTHIKPIYAEGRYGMVPDVPDGQMQNPYRAPYAELEVVAELESTNITVHLWSPILSSDVVRLLSPPAVPAANRRATR
jgi:hypothetical protein